MTGGNLLVFYRMDGAQLAGIQVALAKARTALLFQTTSKSFADRVLAGQTNVLGVPGAAPIDGGIPLMHEDKIVGAIGCQRRQPGAGRRNRHRGRRHARSVTTHPT